MYTLMSIQQNDNMKKILNLLKMRQS